MIWRKRDCRRRDMKDSLTRTTLAQQERICEVDWAMCGGPPYIASGYPRSQTSNLSTN